MEVPRWRNYGCSNLGKNYGKMNMPCPEIFAGNDREKYFSDIYDVIGKTG